VHRIGRTGRAEQVGLAFTFISENNECFFQKVNLYNFWPYL